MANSLTFQTLQDGPRNTVIKVVGVIDTADIAASTIVTAGITLNSAVVTYAGVTTSGFVQGQRVTGTGIPNNAYIISIQAGVGFTLNVNATATNASASLTVGAAVVVDPNVLFQVDDFGVRTAGSIRIDRMMFTVEPQLECRLFWDATTPVLITDFTGAAHQEFYKFGGLQNSAHISNAAGQNGMITLTTQGWSASTILSFHVVLECVKQK